jgi:hypothetical protein
LRQGRHGTRGGRWIEGPVQPVRMGADARQPVEVRNPVTQRPGSSPVRGRREPLVPHLLASARFL